MGTISQKLTYLNDTKQLLKENINNLGGNLTTEPFRQYASVLEGIYERIPKVSGIGTSLSLSPTMVGKIKLNEIQGDTLQDGTPTPSSPVPIQSVTGLQNVNVIGKNLLPYPYFSGTTTNRGITFTPREDGSVLVNGTATRQASFALYGNYLEENHKDLTGNYLSGGTNDVKLRAYNHTGSSYTDLGTDTGSGVQINKSTYSKGYIELVVANGTTINNVIIKPMMLNSLDDTTYEPYKGNTYEVNLGKNLLDTSKFTSTTQATSINSNTSEIDLITNNYGNFITIFDNLSIQKGNYSIWCEVVSGTYTGGNLCFFDLSGTQYSTEFNFKNESTHIKQINLTNGLNKLRIYSPKCESDTKIKIWLIKGNYTSTTIPSFSPYFTPIELNKIGDYEDSIKKSTGKNLFDKSTIIEGKYIDGNGNVQADTNNFIGDYIEIDNTKTYYVSSNYSTAKRVVYYNSSKTFISREVLGEKSSVLTIPNNAKYIVLSCYNEHLDTLQLEQNSTATSYEPYGKVWYIHKEIGKVILDGTENWVYTSGTRERFTTSMSDIALQEFNVTAPIVAISNYFVGTTWYNLYNNTSLNNALSSHNSAHQLNIRATQFNGSVDEFKTWLSTNKPEVIYALATPTYTEITNEELINQLESIKSQEGTTNISITSENLPMIINASALKGED